MARALAVSPIALTPPLCWPRGPSCRQLPAGPPRALSLLGTLCQASSLPPSAHTPPCFLVPGFFLQTSAEVSPPPGGPPDPQSSSGYSTMHVRSTQMFPLYVHHSLETHMYRLSV